MRRDERGRSLAPTQVLQQIGGEARVQPPYKPLRADGQGPPLSADSLGGQGIAEVTERAVVETMIRAYAAAWVARDREAWLRVFATDATQEDRVGVPVRRGAWFRGMFERLGFRRPDEGRVPSGRTSSSANEGGHREWMSFVLVAAAVL